MIQDFYPEKILSILSKVLLRSLLQRAEVQCGLFEFWILCPG